MASTPRTVNVNYKVEIDKSKVVALEEAQIKFAADCDAFISAMERVKATLLELQASLELVKEDEESR